MGHSKGYKCYNINCSSNLGKTLCTESGDAPLSCIDRVVEKSKGRIDREKWEPCEECERRNCNNCEYDDLLANFEPCKSCYNAKQWKPAQKFCPRCGRPLTDEAWAELERRVCGG